MKIIETKDAPKAVGTYSQAVVVDNLVYLSGQIAINPITNTIDATNFYDQATQVFKNIDAILKASNTSFNNVIKVTVFLDNIDNFKELNEIYSKFFNSPYPARSVVEVNRLPKNSMLEIELIAKI